MYPSRFLTGCPATPWIRNGAAGLLALLLLLPPVACQEPPEPKSHTRGVLIRLEGVVSPRMESYLFRQLDEAAEEGADLVIIELESPGGYLDSSLNMATRLRDLDWARTVAFVPAEALSGAAIVALGCDDILMNERAVIGDAGPIFLGPDALFRHAPEKLRSDLARRVRDLAEAKGRSPALAEAMVDMDLTVYEVRHKGTGDIRYLSDGEIAAAPDPAVWDKLRPVLESGSGKFLEVNGRRALELQLAQGLVADRNLLLAQFPLAEPLRVLEPTWIDTSVYLLNLPWVTGFLFLVGLVALYIEFSAPGISLGGLIAGLCFTLFFWSRFLGGTAGWLEVILFLAGIGFLLTELFVLPGFGVAGVTGLALLLVALVMAGQRHFVPESQRELEALGTNMLVVAAAGITFVGVALILSHYFRSLPVLNRLVLGPPPAEGTALAAGKPGTGGPAPLVHGSPAQVGDWGVAESPLRPAGKAIFGEQLVDVVTDGSFVDVGVQVRVIDVRGNRIVVRAVEERRQS